MAIAVAKLAEWLIKTFGLGAGATWPGEIALRLDPKIVRKLTPRLRKGTILVAGTNGKTTTSLMITRILESQGERVIHNKSGANLLNGIASALISQNDADWGVFEVDENALPSVLAELAPTALVLLNLFRDQLDRYGEVDVIVEKWKKAMRTLPQKTTLVVNADDPGIASLGTKNSLYFGVNDTKKMQKEFEHATDSTFCPDCGTRLTYDGIYYSHIGLWRCTGCGRARPQPQVHTFPSALPGLYNQYNTLAAVAVAKALGYPPDALQSFTPAFGRQEEFVMDGRKIKLFLSKNPAGFNASLRTVLEMGAKQFLFVLNDRIPDGRDVSWIWDVDFEKLPSTALVAAGGDRVWDMAIRLKYAGSQPVIFEHLETALASTAKQSKTAPLYVLATYSAMLEVRKILIGRKIL